jgi:hypothetical protein
MSPDLSRAGIQIGLLLVVPSTIMLFMLDPASAEFSISVITLIIGLVFLAGVITLTVRGQR